MDQSHMPKAEDSTGRAARLSLPLTPDGQVDWDHVRPSAAAKFIDILKTDPKVGEAYREVSASDSGDMPDLFGGVTQENVSKGLDLVCSVNALVFRMAAAKWIKHPLARDASGKPVPLVIDPKILNDSFSLTPEQHKELDPRATRLAEKYSGKMPAWLKENLDLYMFVSMFLAYTAQNAKTAIETQIKVDLVRLTTAARVGQPKNPQSDSDVRTNDVRTRNDVPGNGHATEPEIRRVSNLGDMVDQASAPGPTV